MKLSLATVRQTFRRLPPDLLEAGREVFVARAPARLDVLGGISDYSGGRVLEGTLGEAVVAAVQRRRDRKLVAYSFQAADHGWAPRVEIDLGDLYAAPQRLKSPAQVRRAFAGPTHWAAYVLGAFYVLAREREVAVWPSGATVVIDSNIPIGVGVASSGALEVASMTALAAAFDLRLDPLRLARLCQLVENQVAGAPCGIMDQVTQTIGEPHRLVDLLCQPCQVLGLRSLPSGIAAVGVNSAVRHSVGGRPYHRARVGAFMAMKIITTHLGHDPYGGLPCNIPLAEFRARFRPLLPKLMNGGEFLRRYGETDDKVTRVIPDETYPVLGGILFPVSEIDRARKFVRLIERAAATGDERYLERAGQLMYKSHWGYSRLVGLGTPETDLLMRLIRKRGPGRGLYGARTSGGGSGGTMAVLCREDALDALQEAMAEYEAATGRKPQLFAGTSPGAATFGVNRLVI